MGVDNIITFDAHDPRVQNAIPLKGFETVQPAYQFIKGILKNCDDLKLDNDHLMIISPDEGGTNRAVYLANVLGVDMGMFYKRRDYSKIVDGRDYSTIIDGRNPIVAHEFLGTSVEGKDVIIIDDMISSGESMIDVATELRRERQTVSSLSLHLVSSPMVLNVSTRQSQMVYLQSSYHKPHLPDTGTSFQTILH